MSFKTGEIFAQFVILESKQILRYPKLILGPFLLKSNFLMVVLQEDKQAVKSSFKKNPAEHWTQLLIPVSRLYFSQSEISVNS